MLNRFFSPLVTVSVLVFFVDQRTALAIGADAEPDSRQIAARHKAVRDRTAGRFARARLYLPAHDARVQDRIWMAPLVVHEQATAPTEGDAANRFGALVTGPSAEWSIDSRRATVYQTTKRIRIGERSYVQQSFLWFYRPARDGAVPRWRGLRQTLNRRGFPVVLESLSSDTSSRVFFVAKSLENAAARQFGGPLPGRRYSTEPPCVESADTIVARVVRDGPQPMGPYVYLDHAALAITTMKCRCEPAQVAGFSQSRHYRLVPVGSFSQLTAQTSGAADLKLPKDSAPLEGVLRLPPMR